MVSATGWLQFSYNPGHHFNLFPPHILLPVEMGVTIIQAKCLLTVFAYKVYVVIMVVAPPT